MIPLASDLLTVSGEQMRREGRVESRSAGPAFFTRPRCDCRPYSSEVSRGGWGSCA